MISGVQLLMEYSRTYSDAQLLQLPKTGDSAWTEGGAYPKRITRPDA